jgi:hypothetical protein
MAVTTVDRSTMAGPRRGAALGIGTAGLLTVLLGAWGGIVPFVGPLFGFSADGSPAWRWNLAHALLSLTPGAVAVAAGLLVVLAGGSLYRPGALAVGGFAAALCGAWFVIGPVAWPVLEHTTFFAGAPPLSALAHWVGYSLGPGALLIGLGAFALGHPAPEPSVLGPEVQPAAR